MGSLDKLLEQKHCILERVQGQSESGEPVFAYMLIKKSLLPAFRAALEQRDVELSEFGLIVAHGYGNNPPEGLEAQLISQLQGLD